MRKSARQYEPSRTTHAEMSNPFRLSFPGRVIYERTPGLMVRDFRGQVISIAYSFSYQQNKYAYAQSVGSRLLTCPKLIVGRIIRAFPVASLNKGREA